MTPDTPGEPVVLDGGDRRCVQLLIKLPASDRPAYAIRVAARPRATHPRSPWHRPHRSSAQEGSPTT